LGKVLPGEASIAIAVSAPHRAEAFEAARWLIDNIKQDVPIWKQENYANATQQWVHPSHSTTDRLNHPATSQEAHSSVTEEHS
jgi:molybdopterin synthase catalytic subunit